MSPEEYVRKSNQRFSGTVSRSIGPSSKYISDVHGNEKQKQATCRIQHPSTVIAAIKGTDSSTLTKSKDLESSQADRIESVTHPIAPSSTK